MILTAHPALVKPRIYLKHELKRHLKHRSPAGYSCESTKFRRYYRHPERA
jgi:hypothetical protein